ncbi:sulfite exporter TauE/SafE family protein [Evansella tamaricis]|uniref:Probable membrane transporter protein n=1 Tax=Evansella tamaricis TaxID=2069301 RepID=A0ABS6JHK5_9BACI|nr:sulfite exporter TauE/SafE family protein [Evansella tamaricis]MBU9712342.1 sulfite exporter TauE/SafE family protein [Evansella tamaricis]
MIIELGWINIVVVIICALLIGVSKTGLPTLGILVVATMATVFPARESIGIVLPMLIIADVVAVTYYRRSVNWKTLFSLVPWVLGGIVIGFILLYTIVMSRPIEIILGVIILVLIVLQFSRERWGVTWTETLPQSKIFIGIMGTLAGFTTMIGNAAGPIMAVFLLAIALPKKELIGTGAWFFLSVNLIKVPMYGYLGLITFDSIGLNLWLIPAILIGAFLGIKLVPLIPQKHFNTIILILAMVGGIRLLLP